MPITLITLYSQRDSGKPSLYHGYETAIHVFEEFLRARKLQGPYNYARRFRLYSPVNQQQDCLINFCFMISIDICLKQK